MTAFSITELGMTVSTNLLNFFVCCPCPDKIPLFCKFHRGSYRFFLLLCQCHEFIPLFDILVRFRLFQIGKCRKYPARFRLYSSCVAFLKGSFQLG